MKNKFIIFVFIVAIGDIFYQFGYKFMPENLNAMAIVLVINIMAFLIILTVAYLYDLKKDQKSRKLFLNSKTTYLFALSIIGYDLGYLLLYRVAGDLSKVYLLTAPVQAVALLIAGIIIYKEKITRSSIIGMVFALIGVTLLSL